MLRSLGAVFEDARAGRIGPLNFAVSAGELRTIEAASSRAASITARMCAAIVKPTRGTVYVGEYDTRLQPPQAKRRVGFVEAGGFPGNAHTFACELAFRADVWNLERGDVRRRAGELRLALALLDEPWARAVALALVAEIELLVLDQPPAQVPAAVASISPQIAIVETRVARPVPLLRPQTVPV